MTSHFFAVGVFLKLSLPFFEKSPTVITRDSLTGLVVARTNTRRKNDERIGFQLMQRDIIDVWSPTDLHKWAAAKTKLGSSTTVSWSMDGRQTKFINHGKLDLTRVLSPLPVAVRSASVSSSAGSKVFSSATSRSSKFVP